MTKLLWTARSSLLSASLLCLSFQTHSDALASPALEGMIARHAAQNGVPVGLARAVIRIESNFRPSAANAGNYGLMQIRLGTARSLGYSGGAQGLLNPEVNLTYGMRYLGQAYRLAGGDLCGTIARYNGGLRSTRLTAGGRAYCSRARVFMATAGH